MKALYAYFGELGIFQANIPGHSFYQLGLIDSLSEKYDIEKFDFYNYLDDHDSNDGFIIHAPAFADGILGGIFMKFANQLISEYRVGLQDVLLRIGAKEYSKIFLKARFRNLATLEKKMKDAVRFETIITVALNSGYKPEDIIILDTDLSLSPQFLNYIHKLGIQIVIPSVDIPGIGQKFLDVCMELHSKVDWKRPNHIMFYGNLSFENYKQGHEKNPIINEIIEKVGQVKMFDQSEFTMTVAAKETSKLTDWIESLRCVEFIPRTNRDAIWTMMKSSIVSVNVSKDLYLEKNFIPARVYESIIAGVIPVAYRSGFHPAMEFETVDEFFEICKFLAECSPEDYFKILSKIASSL